MIGPPLCLSRFRLTATAGRCLLTPVRVNRMTAAAAALLFAFAVFSVPIHVAHEIHTWTHHGQAPEPSESDHDHEHAPHPVWEHAPEPARAHAVETLVLDLVEVGRTRVAEAHPVPQVTRLSADTPETVPRPAPASPRAPPVA